MVPNILEAHAIKGLDICENHSDTAAMPNGLTPAHQLANTLLGRSLADYVTEKRYATPRWSWRLIAQQIRNDTDGQVEVTGETLRLWFREDVAA
jgi:hypothetical protein